MDKFLQKLKKGVRIVLYGRLLANQNTGKPVGISCHMIITVANIIINVTDNQ